VFCLLLLPCRWRNPAPARSSGETKEINMKAAEKTAMRRDAKRVRALKRATTSLAFSLVGALALCVPASAQVVPEAQTSAGPALTTYIDTPILAWAGASDHTSDGQIIHKVAYKINDGEWEGQQFLPFPAINTTAAPALASVGNGSEGDLSETAYMAWRQDDGLIHYAFWDTTSTPNTFSDGDLTLCDETICETTTSPALAGNNTTLYAAWTTAAGGIQYASYDGNSWTVYSSAAVKNASTTIAPALAVFDNQLFLAWVDPSHSVHIESAALPLSASGVDWISQPAPSAVTSVAPALGIGFYGDVPWKGGTDLFVAWNTGSAIELADWATTAWMPFPGPIPPGPLENYSPAMNTYAQPLVCGATFWFNVAFTLGGSDATEIDWTPVNGATDIPPACDSTHQ
jgi:hypothetical protein